MHAPTATRSSHGSSIRPSARRRRHLFMAYVALIVVVDVGVYGAPVSVGQNARDRAGRQRAFEVRTLDGSENNRAHVRWGRAGTNYRRLAPAHFADGVARSSTDRVPGT